MEDERIDQTYKRFYEQYRHATDELNNRGKPELADRLERQRSWMLFNDPRLTP